MRRDTNLMQSTATVRAAHRGLYRLAILAALLLIGYRAHAVPRPTLAFDIARSQVAHQQQQRQQQVDRLYQMLLHRQHELEQMRREPSANGNLRPLPRFEHRPHQRPRPDRFDSSHFHHGHIRQYDHYYDSYGRESLLSNEQRQFRIGYERGRAAGAFYGYRDGVRGIDYRHLMRQRPERGNRHYRNGFKEGYQAAYRQSYIDGQQARRERYRVPR